MEDHLSGLLYITDKQILITFFRLHLVDIHRQVLEGLGQRSPGALDGDGPGLDGGFDALGDRDQLKGVELLHFPSEN